ncbi:MAG: NAD(P)H-binding protein, partial [Gammaproteobacteria bacterium]|nr:NAD(P)H-binding protein [Gammaproteobacteria bacterium]
MLKILIIGASSGIGLQAVKYGLDSGHEIRAFSRTAENINLIHSRLEKFLGDALDKRDVANAVSGMDVVIQTLGVPFDVKLLTGPIELFSRSTDIVLRAMRKLDVHRIIALTGFGAGTSRSSIN